MLTTTFARSRVKDFLDSLKGKDGLSGIKEIKATEQVLNEIFDVILKKYSDGTRIVFFIDELDRCCPNFAVRLLERIKHYFLNEKVIFVLSINATELQHTIKRHYGNDFNADKYLNRFFDFTIPLPQADMKKYYQTMDLDVLTTINDIVSRVIRKYNLSLREITRYMQYLRIALPKKIRRDYSPDGFYFNMLIPFMIGLKIHDFKKYGDFINGENFSDFVDIMQEGRLDDYCLIFLNNDETFEKVGYPGKKLVLFADKFKPIYECLFGKNNPNYVRPVPVLLDNIVANDKKKILEIISLMQSDKI